MQEDQIGVTYFMYKFTLQFHSTCASVHVACDDIIRDTVIPFHSLHASPPGVVASLPTQYGAPVISFQARHAHSSTGHVSTRLVGFFMVVSLCRHRVA